MTRRPGQPDDNTDPLKALFDSELANQVKASAQQIWLAGMGAFARAQAEGGKVFEGLVKEGVSLQKKAQGVAEGVFADASKRMSERTDEQKGGMAGTAETWQTKAGQQIGQQWDKLESAFQDRTAKALGRLGVPTAQDLDALNARLDAIDAKLAALAKAAPPARGAARPPAAKKAALKKATTAAASQRSKASTTTRSALKRSPARKPSST